jgi:hypothetical protein
VRRDVYCYGRERQQCEVLEPGLHDIANHNRPTADCSSAVNREALCCTRKPTNMVDSVGTFDAQFLNRDGTLLINITQHLLSSCN